ncbi:hypothetical protein [Plantibacter sp. YIM 135347]|uniref:hypothetical protein n=1 Tax=Plantibacter sp. YIM 135347 TaxID=3423919 RepID=UPI003D32EA22
MKGITKLVIGIGMVGSTLLAASAPALAVAEPTGTINRLEGVVHLSNWTAGFPDNFSALNQPLKEGDLLATPSAGGTPPGDIAMTVPKPGKQGVITGTGVAAGLCLAVISGSPKWKTCSGDDNRIWELVFLGDEAGNGAGPGYAIASVSQPGYYLSPANGYNTSYVLSPYTSYASIIDTSLLDAINDDQGAPVDIISPADGETVDSATPTFSGTGAPGAVVSLSNSPSTETQIAIGVVGDDGTWELTSTVQLPAGDNTVRAWQIDSHTDTTITADEVSFTVAD